MNWSDIGKKIISIGAPLLGTALAGSGGTIVGSMVSAALGCENSPESVIEAISSNPDVLIKLKQIESSEREKLGDYAVQALGISVQSIKNAQDMHTKKIELGHKDYTPSILAFMVSFGFLSILYYFLIHPLLKFDPFVKDMTEIMIQALINFVSFAFGFYFGASFEKIKSKLSGQK